MYEINGAILFWSTICATGWLKVEKYLTDEIWVDKCIAEKAFIDRGHVAHNHEAVGKVNMAI